MNFKILDQVVYHVKTALFYLNNIVLNVILIAKIVQGKRNKSKFIFLEPLANHVKRERY